MAIIGSDGASYSYESTQLIQELEQDIIEFGKFKPYVAFYIEYNGAKLITNYDFIDEDNPVNESDIREGEQIGIVQGNDLLNYLHAQNTII